MTEFFAPMKQRSARRHHRCHTCYRTIQPKEQYRFQSVLWDGHWHNFHQCQHCAAISWLYDPRDMDDLISDDGFVAWSDDPRDIRELRYVVQWRRRWARNDGALYPVPTIPEPRKHADRERPVSTTDPVRTVNFDESLTLTRRAT